MESVLAGRTVVEVSQSPAVGLATMVMADFGADVIWFEYGGQNGSRAKAEEPGEGYRVWHRGKRRIPVNLSATSNAAQSEADAIREHIFASADVFVTDLNVERLGELGLDWSALGARRPDLVHAEVSAFGDNNPFSILAADGDRGMPQESLVAAAIGRMMLFEGVAKRPGPVYSAVPVGTHGAAQATLAGVLAQLVARQSGSLGQRQQTSILRALTSYDLVALGASQLDESPFPMVNPLEVLPMLNFQPAQCADGRWMQLGNLLPHLQVNFLKVAGLSDILCDPLFGQDPPDEVAIEGFRQRVCEHMATRTLDEWMREFEADGGVASHPYQSTQQAMQDPDIVANGHSDDSHGFSQLGVLGRFQRTPGTVAPPPVDLTLANLALPRRFTPGSGETSATSMATRSLPLTGVTVVEAAAIIASPLGASMLADLGARVIKLEPIAGDPFRLMAFGLGADRCNTDKESIALNLKSEAGQKIAQDLVAGADLFIHNYRPGVPERLGLDYKTLSKRNARLVHLSATGYGTQGPGKIRPSTHPVPGAALGGVLYQFGELPSVPLAYDELLDVSRRLFRANELNPDPNTSFVVASAAVMGLLAAAQTGQGQKVELDMFGANAYANFDDFVDVGAGSARLPLDGDYRGKGRFEQLYPCREGWLMISIDREVDQQRLLAEIGSFDNLLTQDASYWQDRLLPLGLGAVRADGSVTGLRIREPQFASCELAVAFEHPIHGAGVRHGAMSAWPMSDRTLQGPCRTGDACETLLDQLGLSKAQIVDLQSSEVVNG